MTPPLIHPARLNALFTPTRDARTPQPAALDAARNPAPRSGVFSTLACLGRPQGSAISLAG